MHNIFKFLSSSYFLWLILSIPALGMAIAISGDDPDIFHNLIHPTGEFAARFMLISMMATPLLQWLPHWRGPRWLRRNRRYFGVAAFGYAAIHTLFYAIDMKTVERVFAELSHFYIWTGWLAFLIFIPLAATSFNAAARNLGQAWKTLQRFVYAAALLTFFHWAALKDWEGIAPALVHFTPLLLLTIYRIQRNIRLVSQKAL